MPVPEKPADAFHNPQRSPLWDWLKLGRVSNLPTVWSNCLVGGALGSQGVFQPGGLWVALASASLLYEAGMVLNDWFDREVDAVERPGRPIPARRITAAAAIRVGLTLLVIGVVFAASAGQAALAAAAVLAMLIVAYDGLHRRSAMFIVIMGLCRGMVYVLAAMCQGAPHWAPTATVFAAGLVAYVILISFVARGEAGPGAAGAVIRRVQFMLAGICLLDGVFLGILGCMAFAAICVGLFALTLAAQRHVAGS